jgi:hypothetical protein
MANEPRAGRGPEPDASSRHRQYLDGAGILWQAYERRRIDRLVLVFESANAIRLVRDYPDNWYTLPVRALEALSWCV